LRISVDFTAAIGDRTGIGTYALELVRALLPLAGRDEIRLDVHAYRHPGWHAKIRDLLAARVVEEERWPNAAIHWTAAPSPDGSEASEGGDAPRPPLSTVQPGEKVGLARVPEVRANRFLPHGLLLRAERLLSWPRHETVFGAADVHHGTNFLAPPSRRARIVITVHDLAFVRFAKEIPVPHRYARYIRDSVERADRIIAVSETTRRDVCELFGTDPDRVIVVPEGAPVSFEAISDQAFAALRRGWGLPERYFLFVGTLEPRKNLPRLVRAFGRAASRIDTPVGLLLAGRPGWAMEELEGEIRRCPAPVAAPGYIPVSVRNAALSGAIALAMPSLWEGFGLPVLEAFSAGTPVIASDAGALPEVAGNAALFVDPEDEEGLADALVRLATDGEVATNLVRRGTERVAEFTWERTARETLEVYRNA